MTEQLPISGHISLNIKNEKHFSYPKSFNEKKDRQWTKAIYDVF